MVMQSVLATGEADTKPSLNWANGVTFSHVPYPDNEEIIKERVSGVIHYAAVTFALCPEYEPQVTARICEQSYTIKLRRVDTNLLFVEQNSSMSARASYFRGIPSEY